VAFFTRLLNLARTGRLDRELDAEQQFHLEARIDALMAAGLTRDAATAEAMRRFGGRLRMREASRDVKLVAWLESMGRDARIGARVLRRDAVVSGAAVLSLAIAIGACTAAFALIDALILRELPVRDPASLVAIERPTTGEDERFSMITSYPFYQRVREAAGAKMDVFSVSHQSLRQAILPDSGGVEEKVRAQFVSGNAFDVLGVRPSLGRLLKAADDVTPGGHQVAVISHAFWMRRLGGNPAALGQWVQLEQKPYQIVGVTQAGFTGTETGALTDIWVSNMMWNAASLTQPNWNWLQVWGRLRPGVDADAVRPIVHATLANFVGEQPSRPKPPGQAKAESALDVVSVNRGSSVLRRSFERPLWILGAIVVGLLLIACTNVANLLLARGAAREREMVLRASIGAGRGRLLQQALVEASLLTAAALALGLVFARVAVPLIVGMLSTNENPVHLEASVDGRVILFVTSLGVLTTLLFGLGPALRASAAAPSALITAVARVTSQTATLRALVAAQVAFSVAIVFVAGLLLRSFDRLTQVDLGFTPDRIVLLTVEARDRLEPTQARRVGRQLVERTRTLPGVESASLASWAFFRGWSNANAVTIPGRGSAGSLRLTVSPQFFRTMGTRVLDGREFEAADLDADGVRPVVVNAAFARKYLAGARAVGQRLERTSRGQTTTYEIVGLVADTRDGSVRGEAPLFMFFPIEDADGTLVIRSNADPATLASQVRGELAQVHPSLRLVDVTRQTALVGNTLLRERLLAVLSAFFAAVGLTLAAVGLYGVSSYAVAQRVREIGIRLALGAGRGAVVRAALGRTAIGLAIGIAAGMAGGLYVSRFVRTLLFEIEPLDTRTLAVSVMGFALVSLIATWRPARRATRVDPVDALRAE
jgi:putative ABC transport system permease protein